MRPLLHHARVAVVVAMTIGLAAGCAMFDAPEPLPAGSPLRAADASPDGVRFEVYWATLPAAYEADESAKLWRFVQEERLDSGLRVRLQRNGLRAGVVGGVPPEAIERLLNPLGERDADAESGGLATTGVRRQEMTVRPGLPAQVTASEMIGEADLLLSGERGPYGETFRQVQAIYEVAVERRPGGGHVVSLTPQLHWGSPQMRWVADDTSAIARPKPMRDHRAFADLRIESPLVVGEMLVATSRPIASSRLGGLFHRAEASAEGARKAIVVRMVRAPSGLERRRDEPDF